MTQDSLFALLAFAFATSVTPGPNNMMLLASGANHGFRRTLPHMLGISGGHALMVFLVGLGIGQAILAAPLAAMTLKVTATLYMLWLAWRIATAAPPAAADGDSPPRATGRPFTLWQAAAFQWVNPKAWAMALTATSVHAQGGGPGVMALVALVFAAVNLPSVALWAGAGQALARVLSGPRRLRAFNIAMAVLLVASLYPILQG